MTDLLLTWIVCPIWRAVTVCSIQYWLSNHRTMVSRREFTHWECHILSILLKNYCRILIISCHLIFLKIVIEPNCDSLQVLSKLSMNMHLLMPPDLVIQSDSDDEVVDVSHSQDQVVLSDYLNIMNNSDKVRRWLNFLKIMTLIGRFWKL